VLCTKGNQFHFTYWNINIEILDLIKFAAHMTKKTILLIVLVEMLSLTSAFAEQSWLGIFGEGSQAHQQNMRKWTAEWLVANPTGDLSDLDDNTLIGVAQVDAMIYYQSHKQDELDVVKAWHIGDKHALEHHLLGINVTRYSGAFTQGMEAMYGTD
jgi:hypothetical protein